MRGTRWHAFDPHSSCMCWNADLLLSAGMDGDTCVHSIRAAAGHSLGQTAYRGMGVTAALATAGGDGGGGGSSLSVSASPVRVGVDAPSPHNEADGGVGIEDNGGGRGLYCTLHSKLEDFKCTTLL